MIGLKMFAAAALCSLLSALPAGAETINIAHQADFPPFAYVTDGKSVGLFVDLLRAAAAREGIDVNFVPVPFAQVQGTLQDGRAQAIFPLGITPERMQTFDFSEPFLSTGGAIYAHGPSPAPESLAELTGKTVVTPRTGPLVAYIQKNAPGVNLVLTDNYEASLAQVMSGAAAAAALNYQVGAQLAAKLYPGQLTASHAMFAATPLAVGVAKGQNAKLIERLNAGLAAIKADGTWQQINARWTGR